MKNNVRAINHSKIDNTKQSKQDSNVIAKQGNVLKSSSMIKNNSSEYALDKNT